MQCPSKSDHGNLSQKRVASGSGTLFYPSIATTTFHRGIDRERERMSLERVKQKDISTIDMLLNENAVLNERARSAERAESNLMMENHELQKRLHKALWMVHNAESRAEAEKRMRNEKKESDACPSIKTQVVNQLSKLTTHGDTNVIRIIVSACAQGPTACDPRTWLTNFLISKRALSAEQSLWTMHSDELLLLVDTEGNDHTVSFNAFFRKRSLQYYMQQAGSLDSGVLKTIWLTVLVLKSNVFCNNKNTAVTIEPFYTHARQK